jgi:hypothetical protein
MRDTLEALGWVSVTAVFYYLNHKSLDHRPYVVPGLWGSPGTLIILLAQPRGWKGPS